MTVCLGTANFIRFVVKWWKVVNVKCPGLDSIQSDSVHAIIIAIDDLRLQFLLAIEEMT